MCRLDTNDLLRRNQQYSLDSNTPSSQSSYVDVPAPRPLPPPPPPTYKPATVEDERVALAKEYGSVVATAPGEEPVHPGDPDQYPILLEVHEHNPERRFVLVPTPSDTTDDSSDGAKKLPKRPKSRGPKPEPEPTSYAANTGRKYEARAHREESDKKRDTVPNREKHRIKLDHLPTIVTDVGSTPQSPQSKRAKSTAKSDRGGDDYFSPRLSSRFQNESTLSPDVIEHSSRGRDRAYYRGGSSPYTQDRNRSSHPGAQYEKTSRDDRRYKDKNLDSAKQSSPTHYKRRSTADLPQPVRGSSRVDYERARQHAEQRTPKADRNSYARSDRDTASMVSSGSTEKRGSPPSSEYYYSSDEEVRHKLRHHRRQESETKASLGTPIDLRSSDKRRSRAPSPLPSPRVSQVHEKKDSISSSPRSATFPKDIRFSRSEPRSQPPLSRTSTGRSMLNVSAPIAIPAVAAAVATAATPATTVSGSPTRRSGILPPPRVGSFQSDPRSSAPTLLSSSPKRHARQPSESGSLREVPRSTDQLITSYRRYLDEVKAGSLPDTNCCPRRKAVAGYFDWLTLPHCNNFNICPSCYEANFSNTEFAHNFVPAPLRPADKPLACDFGASRFYHIAYFLMNKYRKADLTLFRNIANVAAKSQPCTGAKETTRIWFSVRDPRSQHPIESFHVCYTCAKTVEVLLPNLTGVFVAMDSPAERTRGVCAMHQQNERRFLYYFDLLEAASDKALITKSTPDTQALANRLRELTEVPECSRHTPVHGSKWYIMRSIPEFTVCEECFGEVVWPMIQSDNSSIAANFHKNPQSVAVAACQLYSERMRKIFCEAVQQSDMRYLASKIREREVKDREFHARIVGLDRNILGSAWVDAEVERAQKEWHRWE